MVRNPPSVLSEVVLSVQALLNFPDLFEAEDLGSNTCNGGNPLDAYALIARYGPTGTQRRSVDKIGTPKNRVVAM